MFRVTHETLNLGREDDNVLLEGHCTTCEDKMWNGDYQGKTEAIGAALRPTKIHGEKPAYGRLSLYHTAFSKYCMLLVI